MITAVDTNVLSPIFLVAAHALACADRLLTRDRGFYRTYFRDLVVLEPQAPPKAV